VLPGQGRHTTQGGRRIPGKTAGPLPVTDVEGIQQRGTRAAERHGRAFAQGTGMHAGLRALPFHAQQGIAAHADGQGGQRTHQRPAAAHAHAVTVHHRRALGEQGHVRGGAAHIQQHGAGIFRHGGTQGQYAHDAGRRAGQDGLHGFLPGQGRRDGPAVGLEQTQGGPDARCLQALLHGGQKAVHDAGHGGIVIGRGDAAREIEFAGQAVPAHGRESGSAHHVGHGQLMRGIAGRELAHAGHGPHALLFPGGAGVGQGAGIQRRHFHTAMVQTAGQDADVVPDGETGGRQTRPGAQRQGHAVGPALHQGVDGQGGAHGHPVRGTQARRALGAEFFFQSLFQSGQCRTHRRGQIFVAGGRLGPGQDAFRPAKHGIGMRAARIDPQKRLRCHAASTGIAA